MEYRKRIRIGNDLFQCVSFVEQKYVVLVVSNYTSNVIPCYTLTLLLAWVSNVICNTVRYIFLGNRIIEQGHCHGHFFLLDERRMRSVEQWNDYEKKCVRTIFHYRAWRKPKILFESFYLFSLFSYNLFSREYYRQFVIKYITFSMYTYAKWFHFLNRLLLNRICRK